MTIDTSPKAKPLRKSNDLSEVLSEARSMLDAGKYDSATDLLSGAKKKYIKNIPVAGLLAEAYSKLGKVSKAVVVYEEILGGTKVPHWVHIGYGNTLEKIQHHDRAIEQFLCALSIENADSIVMRIVRLLKYTVDQEDQFLRLQRIVAEWKGDSKNQSMYMCRLGDLAYQNSDAKTALKFYKNSLELNGEYLKPLRRTIKIYIRNKSYEDAAGSLEEWSRLHSEDRSLDRFSKIVKFKQVLLPHMESLEKIFLPLYYKSTYKLPLLNNAESYDHFLNVGLEKGFNPNPWFNSDYVQAAHHEIIGKEEIPLLAFLKLEGSMSICPSLSFDPAYYLETNPDLENLPSMFVHYCQYGHAEGRSPVRRVLPASIVEEFNEMVNLEPRLILAKPGLAKIVRYPRVISSMFLPNLIREKVGHNISAIVCVPFISHGGADLVATVALKSLQKQYGVENVLLIATESTKISVESWLDKNTPIVFMDNECGYDGLEDKILTLHNIIGQFTPDVILNVNSKLCWEMYREYGRQLSSVTALYAYLFCFDFDRERNRVGYITEYLSDTIQCLSGVFVDNETIAEEIEQLYMFSGSNQKKIQCVYTPYLDNLEDSLPYNDEGGVLWVGRMSEQKRPDILLKIAERMPSTTFFVYGAPGNAACSDSVVSGYLPNIRFMGTYDSIDEIDLSKFKLFLHTSEWEGLPTILITMMALGMPILSSVVGGVGELVDEETGWMVEDFEDVALYCERMYQMELNPMRVKDKVAAGRQRISSNHSWRTFEAKLHELEFLGVTHQTEVDEVLQVG